MYNDEPLTEQETLNILADTAARTYRDTDNTVDCAIDSRGSICSPPNLDRVYWDAHSHVEKWEGDRADGSDASELAGLVAGIVAAARWAQRAGRGDAVTGAVKKAFIDAGDATDLDGVGGRIDRALGEITAAYRDLNCMAGWQSEYPAPMPEGASPAGDIARLLADASRMLRAARAIHHQAADAPIPEED